MAIEKRTLNNRYLSHYLCTSGDLIEAISYSYCINNWIKSKLTFGYNLLEIYREIENLGIKPFIIDAREVKDIKSFINLLYSNRELLRIPFENHIIQALTLSSMLNLISQEFNILISLVSSDTALNYCLTTDKDFSIILYENEKRYYPGFSMNFVYDDVKLFTKYESGLKIINNDDELAFGVLVSAISNIPEFLDELGKEEIENLIYFLEFKCKNNENIKSKANKLKKILNDKSQPCLRHKKNYFKYMCGRTHCVECVQSANKDNQYFHRCLCGKYIQNDNTVQFCLICDNQIEAGFIVKCENSHVFCKSCYYQNSNLCFICFNLRCTHGQYIKKGYSRENPNLYIGCRECTSTTYLV